MNNSKKRKPKFFAIMLVLSMVIGLGQFTVAQDVRQGQSVSISTTEDGKVKLKVIKRDGNDETTFEKTYNSHEEMQNDPDLKKYGIDLKNSFSFSQGTGGSPRIFFHNGPGNGSWKGDDFTIDIDSMRSSIQGMMKGFGSNGFTFNFDDDQFMDMDSLVQRFSFKNDNGRFFFNDEEFADMDSLRDALQDKFGNMKFDFDFDDDDSGSFRAFRFGDDNDNVKMISRIKVFVRSANEEDKEVAGTDGMEKLELRDINFYPNPSDGRFDVELETSSDATIHIAIIDPNGNEVYKRTGTPSDGRYDFRVDLSDEEKGIYIMKVVQNNKALTKRVIIE